MSSTHNPQPTTGLTGPETIIIHPKSSKLAAVLFPKTMDKEEDQQDGHTTLALEGATDPVAVNKQQEDVVLGGERKNASEILKTTKQEDLRETRQMEEIKDHFTLPAASSTLRFRNNNTMLRVYPTNYNTQYVLEHHRDDKGGTATTTTMKQMRDASTGITLLRASYTFVAICFGGVVAVFSVVFLLNLVADLAVASGSAYDTIKGVTKTGVPPAIGVFLAFPNCIYGLASGLVICSSFIVDTWAGSPMLKLYCMSNFFATLFDWVLFFCFLGTPVVVTSIGLLVGRSDWWSLGLLTWFVSVACLFVFYSCTITYFEVRACWTLVSASLASHTSSLVPNDDGQSDFTFWQAFRTCILTSQTSVLAGYKDVKYLSKGSATKATTVLDHDGDDEETEILRGTLIERKTWLARLSMMSCCSSTTCRRGGSFNCYHVLEEPRRMVTVDEAQEVRSFLTRSTWSLEKIYCHSRKGRFATIVNGPDALSRAQFRSAFACTFVVQFLCLLLLCGVLVYFKKSLPMILVILAISLVFWIIPSIVRSFRIYKTVVGIQHGMTCGHQDNGDEIKDHDTTETGALKVEGATGHKTGNIDGDFDNSKDDVEEDKELQSNCLLSSEVCSNDALYLVFETFRLTEPEAWFSWVVFFLEISFLFVWPLITIILLGNYGIAVEFFILLIFSFLRRYLNPATALQEVGRIKSANRRNRNEANEKHAWKQDARLSRILDSVTANRSRFHWMMVLFFFSLFFVIICFLIIAEDNAISQQPPRAHALERQDFISDFEYIQDSKLAYPTCRIGKEFLPGGVEIPLLDFAFDSLMAYKDESIVQDEMDIWFGEEGATDMQEVVDAFRNKTGSTKLMLDYKFLKITNGPAVVSIRGTATSADLFVNGQLWSLALFMQMLRFSLPFGGVWSSVFDELISALSMGLQSSTAKSIWYYKETSRFVTYLEENGYSEDGIIVTGHSLGGGLAMITGTQRKVPAIAFSGPNARLSRRTFIPELSLDDLDFYSFNVIPDRDPIPRIDDVARLKENVRCNAPLHSLFGCHAIERTLCEIMVSCGSQGRPPICGCAKEYGYPEPTPTGNRTFEGACAAGTTIST